MKRGAANPAAKTFEVNPSGTAIAVSPAAPVSKLTPARLSRGSRNIHRDPSPTTTTMIAKSESRMMRCMSAYRLWRLDRTCRSEAAARYVSIDNVPLEDVAVGAVRHGV